MRDGTAIWVTVTNILLGVLVLAAIIYVVSGPFREKLSRLKKIRGYEAELDHDLEELFAGSSRPGFAQRIRIRLRKTWRRIAVRRC